VRIRFWLVVAFIVVPIAEIALLVAFGNTFGFWPTLALVVGTAFLGSWLMTRQGRATWSQIRDEFAGGRIPGAAMAHGAMILIAGALLITPGLITDATGFLLLIPGVREAIRRWLVNRYADRWVVGDTVDLP
jgi:UPF0716 protein FxsA